MSDSHDLYDRLRKQEQMKKRTGDDGAKKAKAGSNFRATIAASKAKLRESKEVDK